jgi:hypothetical protein
MARLMVRPATGESLLSVASGQAVRPIGPTECQRIDARAHTGVSEAVGKVEIGIPYALSLLDAFQPPTGSDVCVEKVVAIRSTSLIRLGGIADTGTEVIAASTPACQAGIQTTVQLFLAACHCGPERIQTLVPETGDVSPATVAASPKSPPRCLHAGRVQASAVLDAGCIRRVRQEENPQRTESQSEKSLDAFTARTHRALHPFLKLRPPGTMPLARR